MSLCKINAETHIFITVHTTSAELMPESCLDKWSVGLTMFFYIVFLSMTDLSD